jgi:soluble lytic murein transglycosylase-like protein
MNWMEEGDGPKYMPLLNAAEDRYALPQNLLARMAFQESSFRTAVIAGQIKSSAGAVGIMQLEPEYFPGAGVSPAHDIDMAGAYVAKLYQRFKDWQLAVAAYDWGPGNVDNYLHGEGAHVLPTETQNYVLDIFTDVPIAGSLLNA